MRVVGEFPVVAWQAITLVALVAAPALGQAAPRKTNTSDKVWTHPDFASFGIDRIAMLPAVTFDGNHQAASLTDAAVAQALRPTGYRWIGAIGARDLLRAVPGGDEVFKGVAARLLAEPRVDSAVAPRLCGMLRCDAVLTVRVDQWQQQTLEWNQSGKPTTSVQLRAALVDSLGRLLWSASGGHTAEGPYQDANAGVRAVKVSGLERTPITNQGGAPTFREVVTSLAARWATRFPGRAVATAAADSAAADR